MPDILMSWRTDEEFLGRIGPHAPAKCRSCLTWRCELKKEYFDKGNRPLFKGKVLGMIFQKPSLRTRVSFDMAMRHMGGDALYLSPSEIGLGQRESIADVAACAFRICPGTHGPASLPMPTSSSWHGGLRCRW